MKKISSTLFTINNEIIFREFRTLHIRGPHSKRSAVEDGDGDGDGGRRLVGGKHKMLLLGLVYEQKCF